MHPADFDYEENKGSSVFIKLEDETIVVGKVGEYHENLDMIEIDEAVDMTNVKSPKSLGTKKLKLSEIEDISLGKDEEKEEESEEEEPEEEEEEEPEEEEDSEIEKEEEEEKPSVMEMVEKVPNWAWLAILAGGLLWLSNKKKT